MSHESRDRRTGAVELLELHDGRDRLDEELRVQKIALRLTPLVATALAAPPLIILFLNEVRSFVAYATGFVVILGVILYALIAERRRLKEEREAIQSRLREREGKPLPERPPRVSSPPPVS